jgi:hypothetical protein
MYYSVSYYNIHILSVRSFRIMHGKYRELDEYRKQKTVTRKQSYQRKGWITSILKNYYPETPNCNNVYFKTGKSNVFR